ncbi:hypothetical protein [Breoghania sp.]|uniref:tetratricopeptide repeat protein n=1 Tax=Breoghania sp. TaxID=2065378 RepID=UPI002AA76C8C|nr:hypothetical protein [Breoghania sp.]
MPSKDIIYLDDTSSIVVFRPDEEERSKTCFVIFSSWGGRSLESQVGGTAPLLKAGYDVVCVQTSLDDWHQNIYPEGICILKEYIARNYLDAKGYGSSMGAFAAILYADILNLSSVLALSPQYTISEAFDVRWKRYDQNIKWIYTMDSAVGYAGELHIVYDPFDLDREHFRRIQEKFGRAKVYGHPIKFGSHPTTLYFNDGGKLVDLLMSFADGNIVVPLIDKKSNGTYLKGLSRYLLSKNKPVLSRKVAMRVLELGDERNTTYRLLSNISFRLQDYDAAVLYARKAADASDNNTVMRHGHLEHLASMLRLQGDCEQAKKVIMGVLSEEPERSSAHLVKSHIMVASDDLGQAELDVLKAIELGGRVIESIGI